MIGRLYLAASIFFAINLADIFGLPYANVFEKGIYLALAAAILIWRRVDWLSLILMAATLLMTMMLGIASSSPNFSWLTWLLSLNQFVIVYNLIGFHPAFRDAETILKTSAWLPLICVASGMIGAVLTGHPIFGREFATGIARLQGALIPAFLSGIAMTGVVAALILGLEWRRLRYLALAAANMVILLMAGGRAAFAVALMVSAGMIAFSRIIHIRDKMVILLAGLLALPVFVMVAIPFVLKRLQFSTDNGRDVMTEYLQTQIDQYPLTGIGFGHQYWQTPREIMVAVGSAAAHNDFLRLIVELGYVGALLFYLMLAAAIVKISVRGGRMNWTAILSFAGFLLLSMSDNALATPAYFPLILVALLSNSPFALSDDADGLLSKRSLPSSLALHRST